MRLLLKQLLVIDSASKWHGQKVDLRIEGGRITRVGKRLAAGGFREIRLPNAYVSPGWLDIGTQIGEPGFEQRETVETATNAATAGGFTGIACFPNTEPALHSKSEIRFVLNRSTKPLIDIFPIGAISRSCEGQALADLLDMAHAGAIAFSDGRNSIANGGLLLRALQYSKATGKPIIHTPYDATLAPYGLVHEGETSTTIGVAAVPALAESIAVARDISLATYAEASMIAHLISSRESIRLIREARRKKVRIGCTTSFLHLIADDQQIREFDAQYKVFPPLREAADRRALVRAVSDGVIDAITAHHEPMEAEIKDREFEYAAFGNTSLEFCFPVLNTKLRSAISLEDIVDKLSRGPRSLLALPEVHIADGSVANLTIFDPDKEWSICANDVHSKSKNSPFLDMPLRGQVLAVVNNDRMWIRPA